MGMRLKSCTAYLALSVGLALVPLSLANPALAQTAEAPAALTVEIGRMEAQTWPDQLAVSGRLVPWQEGVVASELGGQRIEALHADVGDVVKKGDLLVELSRASIETQIRQQEAQVMSAEAGLERARANADRARSLTGSGSGAMSQQQATEFLVAERQAEADLQIAKASLSASQLDLDRTRIFAIDDGLISSRSAALGAVVSPGAEMFRMIRQSRIEWQAEVPLRHFQRVKPGTEVAIPVNEDVTIHGKVRLVSPVSSETTGRFAVQVALEPPPDLPNDRPLPRTGMLISGFLVFGESEAQTLPSTAVLLRDGFSYAFVVQPGEPAKVTRKRIDTGRRIGDRVEILSGLDATDDVVLVGAAFLSEGVAVRVVAGASQ